MASEISNKYPREFFKSDLEKENPEEWILETFVTAKDKIYSYFE